MRLGLWVVLSLSGWTAAANDSVEVDFWRRSGLSFPYVQRFISNAKCHSSADYLVSCLNAIEAVRVLLRPEPEEPGPQRVALRGDLVPAHAPEPSSAGWNATLRRRRERSENLARAAAEYLDRVAVSPAAGRLDFEGALLELATQLPPTVPVELFWGRALSGHLQSFDSHAAVLPTALFKLYQRQNAHHFSGFGFTLDFHESGAFVHEVFTGSPAETSGLREDETVVAAGPDGKHLLDIRQRSPEFITRLISGDQITLKVEREGQARLLHLSRGPLSVPAVRAGLVGRTHAYGYIQLRSFASVESCDAVREKVSWLADSGVRGLILDLRGNDGGDKNAALCLSGLFLGEKTSVGMKALTQSIPSLAGLFARPFLSATNVKWENATAGQITDLPLVVLIDALSASAAELVAGALQHHQRAWLVGERSFGKGSAQSWQSPADNPSLTIARTVARFYQPDGRSNQGVGIVPNFTVPLRKGAADADRHLPRELDLYPNALVPVSSPWSDPRAATVRRIQACIDKTGAADQELRELRRVGRPDHQKAYAAAVLECAHGGNI